MRETLFNWLQGQIEQSHCLDLFAGSGVLGLEALSRGAARVVAVENHPEAAAMLEKHGTALDPARYRVVREDAMAFLRRRAAVRFDIVFADPPFGQRLLPRLAQQLATAACLHPDCLWYLEDREPLADALHGTPWQLLRQRRAGQVHYGLARRGE